jgi:RNA polymerase sigma factor (sigma-70 family)
LTEIEKLKRKDPLTMERIYLAHKNSFLAFSSKYSISNTEALDVYQDAFVALVENAQKGKLDNLSSEIKTYLFSIGKYMIFTLNKKPKTEPLEVLDWEHSSDWQEIDNHDERIKLLERNLDKLGEQCYKILRLFYYENKKLDEMMPLLSYDSKDVLKSQKARCIKQLKELVSKG